MVRNSNGEEGIIPESYVNLKKEYTLVSKDKSYDKDTKIDSDDSWNNEVKKDLKQK